MFGEKAKQSGAKRVVATDDVKVAEVVCSFGGEVCMTSEQHNSGTERLAEVVEKLALPDDEIIVNVQGDRPYSVSHYFTSGKNLVKYQVNMSTLAVNIEDLQRVI